MGLAGSVDFADRIDTAHGHVFLGEGHERSERRAWAVIALCGAMMVLEIVGGLLFGSIALVADGLHMSTHAGALLLAAFAYSFARRHADDARFTFGTGKLGDLAGFTSAIVLAMIAALIGYEAFDRFLHPVRIDFTEALPIAGLGLLVNVASVWLLGHGHDHGDGHHHGHDGDRGHGRHHAHNHGRGGLDAGPGQRLDGPSGTLSLEIFEEDHPPVFRLHAIEGAAPEAADVAAIVSRPGGARERYAFVANGPFLQSMEEIPEPHAFDVVLEIGPHRVATTFEEHEHASGGASHRDNNMRAAVVHVLADAAVSVLVILGLVLSRIFGWSWTDPLAGLVGAVVIATWSWSLVRATGAILLDMNPDRALARSIRAALEDGEDRLCDLHLWRLGPGHLGAIVAVRTAHARSPAFYRAKLARFRSLSHLTVEVEPA